METIPVETRSRTELVDITDRVQAAVTETGIREGVAYVYCSHTTAGVTINENADPTVCSDMLEILDRLVPWRGGYAHLEGNSAAHVKASLMGASCTVLVMGGRLRLGTWQGLYLAEFDGPRTRQVWVKVVSG